MTPLLPDPPALRPGLHVARRDEHHLQVGTDPPALVVAPDVPDVRRVLAAIGSAQRPVPRTEVGQRLLLDLLAAGLVVEAGAEASAPSGLRATLAALLARHGPEAPARLERRRSARVLLDAPPALRDPIAALLRTGGCEPVSASTDQPDVVLVAATGELSRERPEPWVRDGVAHLVLGGRGGGFVLGPFVEVGSTACLRCVDAHAAEHDPRRSVVIEQVAARAGPPPYDPVLLPLVAAWTARELLAHVDGDRPTTWSATVALGCGEPWVDVRRWLRHPHCGCAWGGLRPLAG